MDLFILDSQLRRTAVLDRYESLIWSERFAAYGDFELVIHSTLEARNLLTPGTRLAINESSRVMTIETVEDKTDADGRTILTVKGPSIEDLLNDRVARDNSVIPLPTDTKWYFTDMLPAEIIRTIFKRICIDGALDVGDKIPFYTAGNIYPADNIPEPNTNVSISVAPATVYDAIKQLCDIYDLGFRLYRNGDTSQLMFNVYSGNDRTTLQQTLPAVIFSPELDNLSDVSYLTSSSAYKNVAYVVSPLGSATIYAGGVEPTISGFARKVLFVDFTSVTAYPDRTTVLSAAQLASIKVAQGLATSVQPQQDALTALVNKKRLSPDNITNLNLVLTGGGLTPAQITDITNARDVNIAYNPIEDAWLLAQLTQEGKDKLAVNNNLAAFDGQIPQNSQYRYHVDYELGDLVEIRNADRVTNQMRVTEQIFVSDAQGDRSYPTLAVKLLITPGSWYAYDAGGVWDDASGVWDDK